MAWAGRWGWGFGFWDSIGLVRDLACSEGYDGLDIEYWHVWDVEKMEAWIRLVWVETRMKRNCVVLRVCISSSPTASAYTLRRASSPAFAADAQGALYTSTLIFVFCVGCLCM